MYISILCCSSIENVCIHLHLFISDKAAASLPSSTATALVVPGEVGKLEPAVPKPTDVYSNLKASLTLEAIQLELFTGDSDLVRKDVSILSCLTNYY